MQVPAGLLELLRVPWQRLSGRAPCGPSVPAAGKHHGGAPLRWSALPSVRVTLAVVPLGFGLTAAVHRCRWPTTGDAFPKGS